MSKNLDALSLNTCWRFFLPEEEKVSSWKHKKSQIWKIVFYLP